MEQPQNVFYPPHDTGCYSVWITELFWPEFCDRAGIAGSVYAGQI